MNKYRKTIKGVCVYKAKGDCLQEAYKNLLTEHPLEFRQLEAIPKESLPTLTPSNVYKIASKLLFSFEKGSVSKSTIMGAFYSDRVIINNKDLTNTTSIPSKGTKVWETVNRYVTEGDEMLLEDTLTKAEALNKAEELALKYNVSVVVKVAKRLKGSEGILGTVDFIKQSVDDKKVYVFWVYSSEKTTVTEEEAIDDNTEEDSSGQLSIKVDDMSVYKRPLLENLSNV